MLTLFCFIEYLKEIIFLLWVQVFGCVCLHVLYGNQKGQFYTRKHNRETAWLLMRMQEFFYIFKRGVQNISLILFLYLMERLNEMMFYDVS